MINRLCMEQIRAEWTEDLLAKHRPGTWAPAYWSPTDSQLDRMGLPSRRVLASRWYPTPALVLKNGKTYPVDPRLLEPTGNHRSGGSGGGGDTVGAHREAAGINTHLFVHPWLKYGIGYLAGTRATAVTATLANGQLVPYPVPLPDAP